MFHYFREFQACIELEMGEVCVISWLVYFILVLLVSKLSLHHARFESNLMMRVKKSNPRQIFMILRRRQVSLMDQSLVVCLFTSGITLSIFIL